MASDDVVYTLNNSTLTRVQGTSSKVIVTDITQFQIATDDTVAITLAAVKSRLKEEHLLTSKVAMRNTP